MSLTASLAKLAESFVSDWIFTDISPQLDSRQHENLKGRSTSYYLVQLVQFLHQALQDGCSTRLLAVDYSKAFDQVDNTIALHKLINLGARQELLPWICNFFLNRKHCVCVSGALSEWYPVSCGKPQGTKLSPVVFLAMINDVALDTLDRWKFVDNISLAVRGAAGETVDVSSVQRVMDTVCAAVEREHMVINAGKCATMLVSTCRYAEQSTPVTAGDQNIPQVDSLRLLGVTLQNTLKWDLHVNNMVSKANSCNYFLVVLKCCGVGLQDLVKCCSFVRPILEYAVQVWHPDLSSGHWSELLERVQKHAMRFAARGQILWGTCGNWTCYTGTMTGATVLQVCVWTPRKPRVPWLVALQQSWVSWSQFVDQEQTDHCASQNTDSCVAQLHTSQTCSTNSSCSTLLS